MTEAATAPATASERLDRLPFTRRHLRVLTGSGIGWALDAMDVGLISFIIAALAVQWSLQPQETAWIASIGFVGMAIGASLGGLLADRFGRRQVFALTLLVYGIATGASALVGGLAMLLVLRFFVGLGLGAELPVASTYVSEFAPARMRGRLIVILEAFWAVGWTAAALIGYFVIPASDDGWRWAFFLGAIPAVYALIVRWSLPESARWLERRGRLAEADAVTRSFEDAAPAGAVAVSVRVVPVAPTAPPAAVRTGDRLKALWSAEFRVRTACLWLVWFCVNFSYYGAFIWIPTILVAQGYDLVRSFGFTLIITLAQLPGYAVAAWLIEVWGRRLTLSVFLAGSAVAAVLFGTATGEGAIIATGMALSFFNLGAWGALYAVTPEMYPTSLRATGSGWAAGVGRIASIVAPLTVPPLLAGGGAPLLFVVFASFFVIAAAAAWGLADRRGLALDDR
ncbi:MULTISPECIES: MFS transporter [unclassified Microbacterium]|uniref:MFS transporter n=1 Tax=unclassified Microbacterium TaxID=2609290 RepID=UPI00214AE2D7|nr:MULTISPECIES: MFS transporter [unclassified Microbacterium]MCR2785721.1 MFS transporter [Microbacterium sp. zg.B96]MDL5350162.1 MFS transporter [Microbacterium sp. zg-YB36]WIM17295.1 MFS transporter [Microbacterium sp. zg-B96]